MKKRNKAKEYAIAQTFPDGFLYYFAGINTNPLPGTNQVIKGNVWSPRIEECLPNELGEGGGIFLDKKLAKHFLDKFLIDGNPFAKVVRLKRSVFYTNIKPELLIPKK